jgi:5-methylcytosine-specific restriction endonuclease McrA
MYDRHWQKYRERFLSVNPRCYYCGEKATIVDHLVPHKGDEKLFKQLDNHIPLCKSHHDTATALWDKKYIEGGSIKSKVEWLQWGRAARGLNFKVKVLPFYQER